MAKIRKSATHGLNYLTYGIGKMAKKQIDT